MDEVAITLAVEVGGIIFDCESTEDVEILAELAQFEEWDAVHIDINSFLIATNRNPNIDGGVQSYDA